MYIVIIGGGKVGFNLTKLLTKQGHDVAVIEYDEKHCLKIAQNTNALVIQGDGTEVKYLDEANTSNADIFVAATGVDEDNLVACELARAAYGVKKLVARVNNPSNTRVFQNLKIDIVFDSTLILATLIHEGLGIQDVINLTPIAKGKLRLIETTICSEALHDKQLIELGLLKKGINVVSIIRGDQVFIPHGATKLKLGDHVTVVLSPDSEADFTNILQCKLNGKGLNGKR
jgi:trk system potassium uptake protein TrkA